MTPKYILSSKLTIFLLILLLGILGNAKYRQWNTQKVIEKEKQILTEQAEAQQSKQDDLNRSLSYIKSNSFKERIAREELGLKKDGEIVYGFTEGASLQFADKAAESDRQKSNFEKWWEYFVNND